MVYNRGSQTVVRAPWWSVIGPRDLNEIGAKGRHFARLKYQFSFPEDEDGDGPRNVGFIYV
jgi:hypothetical protein